MPKSPTTSTEPLSPRARLEMQRRALQDALGEFLHEGRRVGDALERAGGCDRALERKAKLLAENAKRTQRDLVDCEAALAALEPERG